MMVDIDTVRKLIENAHYVDNDTNTAENKKEEITMKTTNITLNLTEGTTKFTTLDGTTYTYHVDSKRYAKTVNGKTTRIGKAEYESAKHEYEAEQEPAGADQTTIDDQAELDKDPCFVDPNADLLKPAVLNEHGCVDCSGCGVTHCVHRNCMRRNPQSVGGLGECPRLDVEEAEDPEIEQIKSEIPGIETAEAELMKNIKAEKKARKPRKSKDIAYEGHGVTLTAKQVDFIHRLPDTCFWEHGLDSTPWCDVLADEIGGQFEGKPMTTGAMISTICEKGLAERAKAKVNGRTATYLALTDLGKEIAKELGLE